MQVDATFSGRSMVEMLGVLAIIGVLSVGAIAGYSKAMMKYKLNKQAEAFNMLLNNSLQILHQLNRSSADGREIYHDETLDKLNLIPDGIKLNDNRNLTDIFGNDIWVYSYHDVFGIGYKFAASDAGKEQCYNLAQATKDNSSELWVIEVYKHYNDENTSHTIHGEMYGDKFCNSDTQKCLRNLVINDLDALCNVCDEQDCVFYTLWK